MARKWWTLLVVCVATFMLLLDITIVNVALPDIRDDLKSDFSDLQWVIDAYALTLAALLLTAGSLADLLGRRRVFVVGLVLFTVASLLCGLATTPTFLNLARGFQGVGGAVMFATTLALIAQEFQGRERGTAFGIWGATIGAAVAVGPLVGGALTEWISWHWIFFINIPIGLAAIAVTLLRVSESRAPEKAGLDPLGVVTFSAGLFLLVFALIRGNEEGWGSPLIVGFLVGSAVLLVLFVIVELLSSRPMFDLSLFRKPAFSGVSIAAFCLSASMFAMFLFLTLYVQDGLGFSPLETGIRFLPVTLVSFLAAPIAGRLTEVIPVRILFGVGLSLVGIGLLLMSGLEPASEWTALLPGFIVAGAGIGLTNPAIASTAVGVVSPAESGMASGINSTFRQVGIATGIAGLGAVFQSDVSARVAEKLAGGKLAASAERLGAMAGSFETETALASIPDDARGELAAAVNVSFVESLNELLIIAAVVAFAGAALAFLLVRARDFAAQPEAEPAGEPAPA